jgi:DNA-binding transcriptional MerR regulator
MSQVSGKSSNAFLTIGELAAELGLPQHILRYWETRFPQLKPLQRAGNRRYYRTEDADLARRINRWLNVEGYTIKGVQKLLKERKSEAAPVMEAPAAEPARATAIGTPLNELIAIRNRLVAALAADL